MSLPPRLRFGPLLIAVAAMVIAGSCSSSSDSTDPAGSTVAGSSRQVTVGDLRVPDTLPDQSFPSVLDPPRDGSLKQVSVSLTTVAEADSPTALIARPGHPTQMFLAERAGQVHLVTVDPDDGALRIDPDALLDVAGRIATDGEKGLLGLAFNRSGSVLYLDYTLRNGDTRIDAVAVTDSGGSPGLGKPEHLLGVDQMGTNYHKGGALAVDDKGYLYIGLGDGGPQGDRDNHAQNPDLLLGKILRIDPNEPAGDKAYGIPPENPDPSGADGAPEIFLTGLRNPWRFSIDPANGDLWIGDVGQDRIEEIDRLPAGKVTAGANLGWSGHEGTEVFKESRIDGLSVPPIFETSHEDGNCSITGGVVYRGKAIPDLEGAYLFADLCGQGINALRASTPRTGIGQVTDERRLEDTSEASQVISFATDADGEVYVLSLDGTIKRLDPAD